MIKRCLLLVALALLLLGGGPAAAQNPTVSLDAYRQALDQAHAWIESGQPEQAAERLAGINAVEISDGGQIQLLPVDHGWFVQALRAEEPDLDAISARLAALRYELDHWPAGLVAPDAFQTLDEVLARPEFQPQGQVDLAPLLDWLADLFDFVPEVPGLPWLGDLLAIGAVVLLAAIVVYYAAGLWGTFAARAEIAEAPTGLEPETAGQARARSREMARAGDYRSAVRLLYLSTLLRLEERDLLRYDRTLTNREYLQQVAGHSRLAEALRPVVDTFDRVWYGHLDPDAEGYEAYSQQVEQVYEVEK
jgi:hypothetical protein